MGAITVISKLTALDLLNCDFNSNKLHEILNIVKRRSDNSTITSETSTRITILIRASSSLLAKSKLLWLGTVDWMMISFWLFLKSRVWSVLQLKAKIEIMKSLKHLYKMLLNQRYSRISRSLVQRWRLMTWKLSLPPKRYGILGLTVMIWFLMGDGP